MVNKREKTMKKIMMNEREKILLKKLMMNEGEKKLRMKKNNDE